MSWGVLNAAMLVGLAGEAIPVIIHLLNRRRLPVMDWGAMQFLEPGRRPQPEDPPGGDAADGRTDVASGDRRAGHGAPLPGPGTPRRRLRRLPDLQWRGQLAIQSLVLDVSDSMGREDNGASPLARAKAWAKAFAKRGRPGDSIALVLAGDRARPALEPPTFDMHRVDQALDAVKSARGSSDLPAALAEAFRILERTENPDRDVIVLTDGQRFPWRPGETGRWSLLRALHGKLPVAPRSNRWISDRQAPESPNASIGHLAVSRSLVTPGLPIEVTTTVANAGPGPFSGAAELLMDGQAASNAPQPIGPIAGGARVPVSFRTAFTTPGSHLVAVRLLGVDALKADDVSELPIQVARAFRVLLVNGEPGLEPLSSETDFIRAALAPSGDESPQFRVRVITPDALSGPTLEGERVVVLANVDRLSREQSAAVGDFADSGGGVLVAPGDRTDAASWSNTGWMPARLTEMIVAALDRKVIAHPAPKGFAGPCMTPFAEGNAPPLSEVDFFAFWKLEPVSGSAVLGRLDTGNPWLIERKQGRGRVLVLATPIDAEAGTLPVNPDFVPLAHEWMLYLSGGGGPAEVRAGEPLVVPLEQSPGANVKSLAVDIPSGGTAQAEVIRGAGDAFARLDDTAESGIYRLHLPGAPGVVYGAVARDDREADIARLSPADAGKLAEGWPLKFETSANGGPHFFAALPASRHEVWRYLVLAALAGLCLEIHLTRRLVRMQSATG